MYKRQTLLRAPTEPDPTADQGEHRFAYSFRPHGPFAPSAVAAAAYALNDPLLVVGRVGNPPLSATEERVANPPYNVTEERVANPPYSLLAFDAPNVIIETIKPAEDGDGLIVRLYECERRRGPVVLRAGFPLRAAWRANLLEENEAALVVDDGAVQLETRPFQVITLRLSPVAD